jgi:hypothetical protein
LAALSLATVFSTTCSFKPVHERPSAPAAEDDPLAGAQRHLALREYWASESDGALQAPNRRHNLRSYFEPTGVRVHDRTAGGSPQLLELRLASVGRGERLTAVAPGALTHVESRVEIRRDGLVEWYENSEAGLEQGFTLSERPEAAAPGALVLELTVAGASASLLGESVALASESGRTLRYGKLAVLDAQGDRLAARFDVPGADRVRLVVDDSAARYPIVVDPLLEEAADASLQSNQMSAQLGWSVASAGDVNGDGYADVLVGARLFDIGQPDEGVAFLFLGGPGGVGNGDPGNADTLIQSNWDGAQLGYDVASAGDVNGDGYADVIVGAPLYNAGDPFEGAAFVFLGSASGIANGTPATAHAQLESNQENAQLGYAVASAGDVNGDGYADVVAGAPSYDNPTADEGAAFLFLGSASGVVGRNPATAHAQLESNQLEARLGNSVASAGDVDADGYDDVIVGAFVYDDGAGSEGGAFVFRGGATGIADGSPSSAHAQFQSDQVDAWLGWSVASAGDVNGDGYADVIVSALQYDDGQTDEGAAFVFHGSPNGLGDGSPVTAQAVLQPDQAGALFGQDVASAGDVNGDGYADVIVGAYLLDDPIYPGQTDVGGAFVYLGSAGGIPDGRAFFAYARLQSDQAQAHLGNSVASAGDVNGDGYDDVIAGANLFDSPEMNEGAAFVYHGGSIAPMEDDRLEGNQANAFMGNRVASAGDVNGDGYADVIVGAQNFDNGQLDEGAAFVFLGSPAGVGSGNPSHADTLIQGNQPGARMGFSVASAGDVNGDGYADVIVGAVLYDAGQPDEGAAFVFLGSAGGVAHGSPATAHAQLEADQDEARMGSSVASAGDVNGDGYADVIVGALLYGAGQPNEGAAFVFLGSAAGIADASPQRRMPSSKRIRTVHRWAIASPRRAT